MSADEPLAEFDLHEAGAPAKKWALLLYADYLRLEPADGDPVEVDRADVPGRVQLLDRAVFVPRVLAVKTGRRQVLFQLSPEAFAAVRAWIGPPTAADLQVALKRRLSWVVPVGLLFVVIALPIGGQDWEPVSLSMGLGLILTARLARLWPHRAFFLVVAGWFLALAVNTSWLLYHEWGWWPAALLALQLFCARSVWKEYRRFAPQPPADDEPDRAADDRDDWER